MAAAQPIRYHVTDCHLHFVDFLQHTEGIHALLAAMSRAGVDETMLSGMPLVKQWSPSEPVQPQYYLEDDARCYWYSATDVLVARALMTLRPHERARFHPFICGFNGTDRNAVEHVKRTSPTLAHDSRTMEDQHEQCEPGRRFAGRGSPGLLGSQGRGRRRKD